MGNPAVYFDIGYRERNGMEAFWIKFFGWKPADRSPYTGMLDTGCKDGIRGAITALGLEPHLAPSRSSRKSGSAD